MLPGVAVTYTYTPLQTLYLTQTLIKINTQTASHPNTLISDATSCPTQQHHSAHLYSLLCSPHHTTKIHAPLVQQEQTRVLGYEDTSMES